LCRCSGGPLRGRSRQAASGSVQTTALTTIQRTTINVLSSTVGYVVPMLVNLASTPILLARLGPAAFGIQSLVAVVIGYLTILDMGLDLPITKFLAEDRAKSDAQSANRMLTVSLQLYAVIGLVGMMTIIVLADTLATRVFLVPQGLVIEARAVFRWAGVGFACSVALAWGRAVANGCQRFDVANAVVIANSVIGTSLGVIAVLAGFGVTGYICSRVVTSLLVCLAYWPVLRRLAPTWRLDTGFDRRTLRRIGAFVGYGVWNRILGGVVNSLDRTLMAAWAGVAAAGIYTIPIIVSTSLGSLVSYMLGFVFPMASECAAVEDWDRLRSLFVRSTRFIAALACMVFMPLFALGDRFLALWLGTGQSGEMIFVLRAVGLSAFIATLTASNSASVVVGIGKMRRLTIYTSGHAVVFGGACLFLIRRFGAHGAASAWLCANVVDLVFFATMGRQLGLPLGKMVRQAFVTPLVLGAGLAAVLLVTRPIAASWVGLCFLVAAFEISYVLGGWVLGLFGSTEWRAVSGLAGSVQTLWRRAHTAATR
jgi:O-antigen/teichoic acid export membrane protein